LKAHTSRTTLLIHILKCPFWLAGILDMLDVLAFLALVAKKKLGELTRGAGLGIIMTLIQFEPNEDMDAVARRSTEFNLERVQEVMGTSGKNPFSFVHPDTNVSFALRVFAEVAPESIRS
jgi:hypothetical protein